MTPGLVGAELPLGALRAVHRGQRRVVVRQVEPPALAGIIPAAAALLAVDCQSLRLVRLRHHTTLNPRLRTDQPPFRTVWRPVTLARRQDGQMLLLATEWWVYAAGVYVAVWTLGVIAWLLRGERKR